MKYNVSKCSFEVQVRRQGGAMGANAPASSPAEKVRLERAKDERKERRG